MVYQNLPQTVARFIEENGLTGAIERVVYNPRSPYERVADVYLVEHGEMSAREYSDLKNAIGRSSYYMYYPAGSASRGGQFLLAQPAQGKYLTDSERISMSKADAIHSDIMGR